MKNPEITALRILTDKLADELTARLAELAERKETRLTFHLATLKLGDLEDEAKYFSRFIRNNRFKEKRDRDISHKVAPQTWDDRTYLHIDYRLILRAVAMALRLMKKIDRRYLGPSAPLLWQKVCLNRFRPMSPPRVSYMILPHMYLSPEERQQVISQEMTEGSATFEPMKTLVNGIESSVLVYKKWSGVLLRDRLIVLETYPLQQLSSINMKSEDKVEAAEEAT